MKNRAHHLQDERLFDCYLSVQSGETPRSSGGRAPDRLHRLRRTLRGDDALPGNAERRRDRRSRRDLHARAPPCAAAAHCAPARAPGPPGPRDQLPRPPRGSPHQLVGAALGPSMGGCRGRGGTLHRRRDRPVPRLGNPRRRVRSARQNASPARRISRRRPRSSRSPGPSRRRPTRRSWPRSRSPASVPAPANWWHSIR